MRKFILGTDWWTDCDDVVALRLLARAHKAGEIRLLGVALNGCMEYSVSSVEGFLHTEGIDDLPIGIDLNATDFGGNPPYQKRLSQHAGKYRCNTGAENAVRLYRTLLARAGSPAEIIEIGYPQVLADLLQSGGDDISPLSGMELVRKNVSRVWMMAGRWDQTPGRENNFIRNPRSRKAAHLFCALCPVPVVFLGFEVGATVISGGNLKEDDPVHLALADHGSPGGRSSWDPMLCLLAVIGDEAGAGYRVVRGKASVDAETGENYFSKDERGPHAYVIKNFEDSYYAEAINRRIV